MNKSIAYQVIFISISIFILSSLIIIVAESIFPYTYIENYNFFNNNYIFASLFSHSIALILIYLVFFKKNQIKIDLQIEENHKFLKFYQIITILGLSLFSISKFYLMQPEISFLIDPCSYADNRKNWINSGSYNQNIIYKILSPLGMLFVNFFYVLLFINFNYQNLKLKFRIQNYILIFLSLTVLFVSLYSKNIFFSLIIFILVFNLINFLQKKKILFSESFLLIFVCLFFITSYFYLRMDCNHSNKNEEFEIYDRNISNFKNQVYQKKENFLYNIIKKKTELNFLIYYAVHSKQNSDLLALKIKNYKKNNQIDKIRNGHIYFKTVTQFLSRKIFFKNFNRDNYLIEKYNFNKPPGGLNLHIYLWEGYNFYGIILFNFVFFIPIIILNLSLVKRFINNSIIKSITLLIIISYFVNLFYANLFLSFTVFTHIFAYFNFIIFFLLESQKNNLLEKK